MTKKKKIIYSCSHCGYSSRKWLGHCPSCDEWNCFEEEQELEVKASSQVASADRPVPIHLAPDGDEQRLVTSIGELDRVLGGGVVPGSVVLIGGDPGIGKSTILLHLLSAIAGQGSRVLYVSGEESARQVKLRAKRLNCLDEELYLATQSNVESIVATAKEMKPAILAVDSIQTMTTDEHQSAPGSVTQVRESAAQLLHFAKTTNVPVILVGHVTKDGALAGPKILEHMVDTVLYFEGDRNHAFRILRTVKNRFGSTNEIGVFEMKEEGLMQVANPSSIFLAERPLDAPGSVVMPSAEGSRPILVEVQALVSPTNLGTARRTAIGADPQRLALLCAVIEKKAGLDLYGNDIFLNVAGGLRIDEPALDLAVVCALVSSLRETVIPPATVVFGEVGLAGEVRGCSSSHMRLTEAERLGFTRCILPRSSSQRDTYHGKMELVGVSTIGEVLEVLFSTS